MDYSLELSHEYDNVKIYALRQKGETYTDFDKFMLTYITSHKKDIETIASWLKNIGNLGAFERKFRPEGAYSDRIYAIPIDKCKLRLYCIRISDAILIIGDGGEKPPNVRTYNEKADLNDIVTRLQKIDKEISRRQKIGTIEIIGSDISGNLDFTV